MAIPYYDLSRRTDVQGYIAQWTETLPSGCVLWTGEVTKNGYARLLYADWSLHGLCVRQLNWCLKFGQDLPHGVWLYGTCPERACVNADHQVAHTARRCALIGRMRRDGSLAACIDGGFLVRISPRKRGKTFQYAPVRAKRSTGLVSQRRDVVQAEETEWPFDFMTQAEFRRINRTCPSDRTAEERDLMAQYEAAVKGLSA